MIRMYSKRLLNPYLGVIQVAELESTRAMSADGVNWVIQYAQSDNSRQRSNSPVEDASKQYSMVATIVRRQLEKKRVYHYLDPDIQSAVENLYETVSRATVPFTAEDRYEYWLLDDNDGRPLALLQSTANESDMQLPPPHPVWLAMPAAQLEVKAPEPDQDMYVPPVNYRLQSLIEERAGKKPRAAWFERSNPSTDDFPPCLIREDWENEQDQQLCDLYIHRLAPRLLMMHGLSQSVRSRLEQAACEFVLDVERFYPLYPEVLDESPMNIARVEAQLRRANKE